MTIIADIRVFAVPFAFASILAWNILVDAANTIYARQSAPARRKEKALPKAAPNL